MKRQAPRVTDVLAQPSIWLTARPGWLPRQPKNREFVRGASLRTETGDQPDRFTAQAAKAPPGMAIILRLREGSAKRLRAVFIEPSPLSNRTALSAARPKDNPAFD